MKETLALIERVRRVNPTHQQITLTVDQSLSGLKAGQMVLARVGDSWNPYLRETWFPVALQKNALTVECPAETFYTPGQVVSLLGIVGKPFRFRRTLRSVLLMVVETDPAPLLMTIPALLANKVSVTLLLIGSAKGYETEHVAPEVEILKGDADFNWANRVTTVGWADQVFVVVPPADEMATFARVWALFKELRADIPPNYLFGVFRPPLPCGVGACGACILRGHRDTLLTLCTEGPAFDLTELRL